MSFVACTRMYDATPEVRRLWHALMKETADAAGLTIECIDHAAPLPLTDLWARDDLVLAFMCGFPLATRYPDAHPLAAPVTVVARGERPTYRSTWLVRADSAFDSLESTFGHRIGWTALHSHSGFNAPRHALLAHRTAARPLLYTESVGPLEHPRAALTALLDGRIDVTAVDGYWWWLLARHDPDAAAPFRAVGDTGPAPFPPLICAAALAPTLAEPLVAALEGLHRDRSAATYLEALGIERFAPVARTDYAPLAEAARIAVAENYPTPA